MSPPAKPGGAFSDAQVSRALEAVPQTSSATLRRWRERADANGIARLSEACAAELALRGVAEFDGETAALHAEWSQATANMELEQAVGFAFGRLPPHDYEIPILRAIAARPGISATELEEVRGKGDVSLIIGHFVYDRIGCFRKWLPTPGPMSDLVLERDRSGGAMRYSLRPEALRALRGLGIV